VDTILVAAEASWIRSQVLNAFVSSDQRVVEVERGQGVRTAVAEYEPSVVILDMQIGNMGGIAVALDLRLEAGEGRLPEVPILLLLDREADHFLAKRADVDGTLVKPLDAGRLRRAVKDIIARGRQDGTSIEAGASDRHVSTDPDPEPVEMTSEA
jgi:DNA-binding response OmpR family regulator